MMVSFPLRRRKLLGTLLFGFHKFMYKKTYKTQKQIHGWIFKKKIIMPFGREKRIFFFYFVGTIILCTI